ncbi:MAG: ATP-dependent DNA helicase RecG, partial [Minisyncoccia bacterium]
ESQKKALKRLKIETLSDLLYFFPSRYGHVSQVKTINQADHDDHVTIYGIIRSIGVKKTYQSKIPTSEAIVEDINGDQIKVIWFHQAFIAKTLHAGQNVRLTGKISLPKSGGKSLLNPEIEKIKSLPIDNHNSLFSDEKSETENFGFPVYRESRGITSKWIYHTVLKILASGILDNIEDTLPLYIREKYKLPSLGTALFWIHTPKNQNDADSARKRFAFEEIFLIQLQNQQRRIRHKKNFSYQLERNLDLENRFIDRFPFTPTDGQTAALESIMDDMCGTEPMTRLLEGDVGSGKTFVAAVTAHSVTRNKPRKKTGESYNFGHLQVAYMAPTEVLATQLFENFVEYFTGTGVQIGLMTGSGCRKFPAKTPGDLWTNISKSQLLKWIANGEIPIVIGTHALIQKKVAFQDLALVIIDEQHRFGTKQRMNLSTKDHRIPHYLSMTATPIPRTLALTMYGDLDLSIVDSMPTGRKPVITEITAADDMSRNAVYDDIRSRLADGRQAYVICPRIFEPDPSKEKALQLKSVTEEAARLQKNIFPNYRVGIMHSKMKKNEKDDIMEKFYAHEIDILVSTSVVEVGVNVPNATSIIIEGAERFGLAQLHQLRGRVIRSNHQAYCYLFANAKSDKTVNRMQAIVTAKNGFELAEIDLALRGAGDLAGLKQWGMSDLAMDAIKNIKMVEFARAEAKHIIENDEALENFPELLARIKSDSYKVHFE